MARIYRYPKCMPRFYKVGRWLKLKLSRFGQKKRIIAKRNDRMCLSLTLKYAKNENE